MDRNALNQHAGVDDVVDMQARVCTSSEWSQALSLMFARLPEPQRTEHVADLIRRHDGGRVNLTGLHAAFGPNGMLGSMLCISGAGHTVMVWPPVVNETLPFELRSLVCTNLLESARHFAVRHQGRLIQALLSKDDSEFASCYLDAGFFYLTHMVYLRRNLEEWTPLPLRQDVEYHSYTDSLRGEFLRVLERSYEGSLDCPELAGVRQIEDVLESHRAQGEFDPNRWFLVRQHGNWVGCLLLAGLPDYGAFEIAYLAVLPDARGRRLGIELTRKALHEAMGGGGSIVTLAMDARNDPAKQMYASQGFTPWDARDVYLLLTQRNA